MLTADEYRAQVAASMTEADLQARVIRLAKITGWRYYHTHDSRRSVGGFPDLVLVHPRQRRILYRELKRRTGRVSPEQTAWIAALAAAGADVRVWRPMDLLDGTIAAELSREVNR
jgi:hypothetical protein